MTSSIDEKKQLNNGTVFLDFQDVLVLYTVRGGYGIYERERSRACKREKTISLCSKWKFIDMAIYDPGVQVWKRWSRRTKFP